MMELGSVSGFWILGAFVGCFTGTDLNFRCYKAWFKPKLMVLGLESAKQASILNILVFNLNNQEKDQDSQTTHK
jgi:hypothetical protein